MRESHEKKHVDLLQLVARAQRGEQLRIRTARKDCHRPGDVIAAFVMTMVAGDDEMVVFQIELLDQLG